MHRRSMNLAENLVPPKPMDEFLAHRLHLLKHVWELLHRPPPWQQLGLHQWRNERRAACPDSVNWRALALQNPDYRVPNSLVL